MPNNQDIVYRKPYYVDHRCRFSVIKKSVKDTLNGKKWFEKCRCGRTVLVDCNLIVEGANSPRIKKHWYDKEGNFERTTGGN